MTLENLLGGLVANGKITTRDADIARTYGQYLTELHDQPGRGLPARERLRHCAPAFRARWLPYLLGEADGPAAAAECADCTQAIQPDEHGNWVDATGSDVCPATAGPCPNLCRPHTVEPACGVCGGQAQVFDRHTPLPNPSNGGTP